MLHSKEILVRPIDVMSHLYGLPNDCPYLDVRLHMPHKVCLLLLICRTLLNLLWCERDSKFVEGVEVREARSNKRVNVRDYTSIVY